MVVQNSDAEYDVAGIGSALLDFTVEVNDITLRELDINKGEMHLVDKERSREILSRLEGMPMEITPGGSSANTLAGISNLGGKGIFFGKVGSDNHGDIYIRDTEKSGVKGVIGRYNSMTGHAITFITPDSERSFAVHLGAALQLSKDDLQEKEVKKSKIVHIEGYMFELLNLKNACMYALEIAKKNNILVSVDLSDPALISRIYNTFKKILEDYVDIIFVNEAEAMAFTGKEKEDALSELYRYSDFAVVKLGAEGSLIKSGDRIYQIPAYRTSVVNTNGAGDMYAAGVLYGIAKGFDPEKCGKIGSYAASKVVSQVGARLSERIEFDQI